MKINSSLFNIPIINNVIEFDSADSTNTRAKEFARRGSVDGSLFLAHRQTAGKGRMGRSFSSPMDEGIYMSLLLRPDMSFSHISNITLLVAVAIIRALKKSCNITAEIKWPNDIILNEKKLAGILTEAGQDYVIIGTGINVSNTCFPESIQETATSIFLETGMEINEFALIYSIWESFSELYNKFVSLPNIEFITEEYNKALVNYGREVYIIPYNVSKDSANPYDIASDNLTAYTCCGIDKNGGLLCKDATGIITTVSSGEVSLRGTKGYSI